MAEQSTQPRYCLTQKSQSQQEHLPKCRGAFLFLFISF
jgi:hypothetical protein